MVLATSQIGCIRRWGVGRGWGEGGKVEVGGSGEISHFNQSRLRSRILSHSFIHEIPGHGYFLLSTEFGFCGVKCKT